MTKQTRQAASERLIHALDMPSIGEVLEHVERLAGVISRFKVGLELFTVEGPRAVEMLRACGARVFLDLKLHDIPETVRRAARAAAATGAELLTVHADGGRAMMEAAVAGAAEGSRDARVLAVTVLTSLARADLEATGCATFSVEELVLRRARLARDAGCHGVIASPQEAAAVRAAVGPGFLIVTPGVRPSTGAAGPEGAAVAAAGRLDDQKRVGTAWQAISDGADAVVVGRPIRDAADPRAAALALVDELERRLAAPDPDDPPAGA